MYAKHTVGPPVENIPKRKFGQLHTRLELPEIGAAFPPSTVQVHQAIINEFKCEIAKTYKIEIIKTENTVFFGNTIYAAKKFCLAQIFISVL